MLYVTDEGKTGYKVADLLTEKLVKEKKECRNLLELVRSCSAGDKVYTEQSRSNFAIEERSETEQVAKSIGVKLEFIPTRAIKIYRFDHNEEKAEGKNSDLMDVRRLCRIVKSGIQTTPLDRPHPQEYYDLLNETRDKAKDRTVVLRRMKWRDKSVLSILPPCEHRILGGGQKKLRFNPTRVIPLVIAAQETVKVGRGFKFYEALIGNFGAAMPCLFRSNINFHWMRTEGTKPHERKKFFLELRPALKWIFQTVKKVETSTVSNS